MSYLRRTLDESLVALNNYQHGSQWQRVINESRYIFYVTHGNRGIAILRRVNDTKHPELFGFVNVKSLVTHGHLSTAYTHRDWMKAIESAMKYRTVLCTSNVNIYLSKLADILNKNSNAPSIRDVPLTSLQDLVGEEVTIKLTPNKDEETAMPDGDKFFQVYCPTGTFPRVNHNTQREAEAEAKRLAAATPGSSFFVMAPISVAETTNVKLRKL